MPESSEEDGLSPPFSVLPEGRTFFLAKRADRKIKKTKGEVYETHLQHRRDTQKDGLRSDRALRAPAAPRDPCGDDPGSDDHRQRDVDLRGSLRRRRRNPRLPTLHQVPFPRVPRLFLCVPQLDVGGFRRCRLCAGGLPRSDHRCDSRGSRLRRDRAGHPCRRFGVGR